MDKWVAALIIFGILGLALIAIQPTYLAKQNDIIDEKLTAFTHKWENRIKISNSVNNDTQLTIKQAVLDIMGNLSAHRHVTNATFDKVQEQEHSMQELIKKFNNTNEVERGKAVDKIIKSVEEIKNLLNKTS